jgi:hypothetical protein
MNRVGFPRGRHAEHGHRARANAGPTAGRRRFHGLRRVHARRGFPDQHVVLHSPGSQAEWRPDRPADAEARYAEPDGRVEQACRGGHRWAGSSPPGVRATYLDEALYMLEGDPFIRSPGHSRL